MRKALTSFVMLAVLSTCGYAVQVDGYCYLENQTNHEETKVLFQADSPGAVTDSTYTDSTGYYQIDLSAGVYDVYFTHQGYFGYEILDQLFLSTTTLTEVTLAQAPAGIDIYGELSGVLVDTTYFVIGDIWVSSEDSLTIEAGANLIFSYVVQFDIDGYLYAAGTETDSIRFINSPDLTWCGIDFNDSSNDSSRLEYCLITGGNYEEGGGIYCDYSSPAISNCTISGNSASNDGGGIRCCDNSSPAISNCTISGNSALPGGGIYCWQSSPTIDSCTISGNSAGSMGGGISCAYFSYPSISNCTISGNSANKGGGVYCYSGSPTIENCTISGNSASIIGGGIVLHSNLIMVNTIVEGNTGNGGIRFQGSSSQNSTITYGDFYNNQNGNFAGSYIPQWLGTIITINANGDSCDLYMNIFENPLFYSTTGDSAFYLTENSPCIDAGDPASPPDPDGTVADIGAFYYDQGYIPPEPDIEMSVDELDFGLTPVGNQADLPLMIYSIGDTTLVIYEIFTSEDAFYTDFDPADSLIEPGDSLELTVTFEPLIERIYDETLFIVSNAEEDTVTVSLLGDGGAVPDSVENLVITLEYPDAVLSWDAVTTSVSGYPIQVDYYLIFFETDAYDEFEFLAYTVSTTYTHSGVVQFAESQFYFVEAYIGEIGALEEAIARGERLSREELYRILNTEF